MGSGCGFIGRVTIRTSASRTSRLVSATIALPRLAAHASITDGKAKIAAKFDINRKDFGIVYAGKADDLIRDDVVIELKLEAVPES